MAGIELSLADFENRQQTGKTGIRGQGLGIKALAHILAMARNHSGFQAAAGQCSTSLQKHYSPQSHAKRLAS